MHGICAASERSGAEMAKGQRAKVRKSTVCWGVEWKEASKKWLNEQMSTGTQKAEGVQRQAALKRVSSARPCFLQNLAVVVAAVR